MSSDIKHRPAITPTPDGPFQVTDLQNLKNRNGVLEAKQKMWLCRCGASANKPYCDGTHKKIGFSSAKLDGRVPDRRESYAGEGITIHDNRGICSHAGYCTDGLPSVFLLGKEPWIEPRGASRDEIVATIRKCPSGALSYSIDGVEHRDHEGEPAIFVSPNGPYVVTGGPELRDTAFGEGASTEHYTLCRCGGSKNKPFCDGQHWSTKFADDKN
jgi:CDGSH-type Zn-finger protein